MVYGGNEDVSNGIRSCIWGISEPARGGRKHTWGFHFVDPSNLISKTNVALSSSRQPGLSQPDKGTHTISTRSKVNLLKTMVGEALAQNDTMRMLHVNGYVNLVTK